MLLLLDNLEQVDRRGARAGRAPEACPNLSLLVTSRELLRSRGRSSTRVPPARRIGSSRLFCERSQLEPDDDVAELCRRLDDMPLARRARRRPHERCSPRRRSSTASPSGSTCLRAAATPTAPADAARHDRVVATSCSRRKSSSSSRVSPSSPAAARSRRRRKSRRPTSTRCSRSSRRACSASRTAATGCSRRSASTRPSGSRVPVS